MSKERKPLAEEDVLKLISPTGEVGQCRQFIKTICENFGEAEKGCSVLRLLDLRSERSILIVDYEDEATRKVVGAFSKVEIKKQGEKTTFFFTDERAWVIGSQGKSDLDRYSIPQIVFPVFQDVWKLIKP